MPPKTHNARPVDQITDIEPLQAFDELLAAVAEIDALAHAADQVLLPWIGDPAQRREVERLGYYVSRLAEVARITLDDAEHTAAALVRSRRPAAGWVAGADRREWSAGASAGTAAVSDGASRGGRPGRASRR